MIRSKVYVFVLSAVNEILRADPTIPRSLKALNSDLHVDLNKLPPSTVDPPIEANIGKAFLIAYKEGKRIVWYPIILIAMMSRATLCDEFMIGVEGHDDKIYLFLSVVDQQFITIDPTKFRRDRDNGNLYTWSEIATKNLNFRLGHE